MKNILGSPTTTIAGAILAALVVIQDDLNPDISGQIQLGVAALVAALGAVARIK
jgi:hypothetical protein